MNSSSTGAAGDGTADTESATNTNGAKKFGFSLLNNKKKNKSKQGSSELVKATTSAFGVDEEDIIIDDSVNIRKEPLIIPCQKDSRQSLQEQARAARIKKEEIQPDRVKSNDSSNNIRTNSVEKAGNESMSVGSTDEPDKNAKEGLTDEDHAAIKALKQEASSEKDGDGNNAFNHKRVIASSNDTFQRQSNRDATPENAKEFDKEVEDLPPDLSVTSHVYKAVPIKEFGAAMLRGMGWTGNDNDKKNNKNDSMGLPRPSRLGLGATPKMMEGIDAPDTHSRRKPRRQDQVQKDEQLRRQREQMEKERQRQYALDRQRVLQIGSIVHLLNTNDQQQGGTPRIQRAMIEKLTGVPGLNMIEIVLEGETVPTKVKKGSVELVDRDDLNERPFQQGRTENDRSRKSIKAERDFDRRDRDMGSRRGIRKDRRYREDRDRDHNRDRDRDRNHDRDIRERDRDRSHGKDRNGDGDRDRHKRSRDGDRCHEDDQKRHRSSRRSDSSFYKSSRSEKESSHWSNSSWLIPNIRVRVISSKYGSSVYKEKGLVVDVTRKGVATLKMGSGQVISAPERHLETALPKVGGNAIILSGNQRFSKGRLLERDSKKNRGVVQVYEDMSVVTTSLDDMAEWCGPLDDDLDH